MMISLFILGLCGSQPQNPPEKVETYVQQYWAVLPETDITPEDTDDTEDLFLKHI